MSKMAIAYKMMKKKKMADGGGIELDAKPKPSPTPTDFQKKIANAFQAKGGMIKGVHESYRSKDSDYKAGYSEAGRDLRMSNIHKANGRGISAKIDMEDAKEAHAEKLSELKSMPKANLQGLAEGGEVGPNRHRQAVTMRKEDNQKGVHKTSSVYTPGESKLGYNARASHEGKVFSKQAKSEHEKVMAESASIKPKLKGLAEGGPVNDEDDDLVMKIMKKRYSEGGKVAQDTGEGDVADEMPNQFDDEVLDDNLSFHDTGANSGDELGDAEQDEERHDIVSRIMKSQKKKDKNPKIG